MKIWPVKGTQTKITQVSTRFRWRIGNFSILKETINTSDHFLFGSYKWRFVISPDRGNVDRISICLITADSAKFPYPEFSLAVVNQIDDGDTVKYVLKHEFIALERILGVRSFMPLSELNDPNRGFILNDTCIVEAELSVPKGMENLRHDSKKKLLHKSAEVEPQSGVSVEVMTPIAEVCPVTASLQRNEFVEVEVVESVDKVRDFFKKKHSDEIAPCRKFSGAGQLFEGGRHRGVLVLDDEKFEDIGGFSILKPQASLYKQIWLKYGHIASSKVLTDLYSSQVAVVTELMTSIMDMHDCHPTEVSPEMIDSWEKKIKVAEKLEFNIRWLRERFEEFKKDFNGEQKLKAALLEQDQAKVRFIAAKKQLALAKDEFKKAEENLSDLETRITPLLIERQKYLEKDGGWLVHFDDDVSLSLELPQEEPDVNSSSKTIPPTGSAAETERTTQSTYKSTAEEAKRKSPSDDGRVDGIFGEPSIKKLKTWECLW